MQYAYSACSYERVERMLKMGHKMEGKNSGAGTKMGKKSGGGGGENAEEDKEGRKEVDRRTGNTKREQTTLKETRWAEACV